MTSAACNAPDEQILEAACVWISRIDAGLESGERESLQRWLADDPRHGEALLEVAKTWDDMGIVAELSTLFPLQRYAPERVAVKLLRPAIVFGGLIAAISIGWGIHHTLKPQEPVTVRVSQPARIFETAVGERSTVRLADGSKATLNTDSLLNVRFSQAERLVEMRRGETYFEVAHDPDRPFVVRAGNRLVEAVGTAFNLRMDRQDGLKVTVVEGVVRILKNTGGRSPRTAQRQNSAAALATLNAGETVVVDARIGEIRPVETADLDVELAWQGGMILFEGEPLEEALAEMSRYTTTEFIIGSDSLKSLQVGGYFRTGDIESLLTALKENFAIDHARLDGNQILLIDQSQAQ